MVTRLHPYWPGQNDASRGKQPQPTIDAMKPWIEKAETMLKERPGLALGVAIGIGVTLGLLIKRR